MSDDLFKEYGAGQSSSVQEAIEKFSVDLLMQMCGAPKKIVLDKHTFNKYLFQIAQHHDRETANGIMKATRFTLPTSAGHIEIVSED